MPGGVENLSYGFQLRIFTCLMKVFSFVWCRAVSAEKLANQKSRSVERKLKQHLRVWWRPMKNMGGSLHPSLMADVSNPHLTKNAEQKYCDISSVLYTAHPFLLQLQLHTMNVKETSKLFMNRCVYRGRGKKKMLFRIMFRAWRMVAIEVTWADVEIASFAPIQPTLSSASFHDSSTKQQYWKVYPLLLSSFKCKWNS